MHKVLIIEPEKLLRDFLEEKLKSFSMEVITCRDGFEGLVRMKNERPDLIIMNLELNRVSSLQIAKEKLSYKTTTNIPIILLASKINKEIIAKFAQFKVTKIVNKPIKIDTLIAAVNSTLNTKIKIDETPSLIDIHLNDDILFIEIANGLNIDKFRVLEYKIEQMKNIYKTIFNKVLILMSNIQEHDDIQLRVDRLLKTVISSAEAQMSGVKILSASKIIQEAVKNSQKFSEIEVTSSFEDAIDTLGKLDPFSYGNEIHEIKSDLLSKPKVLKGNDNIEFDFSTERSAEIEKNIATNKYTISIIDDDLYILEFIATVLDRPEWKVNTYENPKLFFEDLPKNKPDLIFLDLMMPEMNGFDVLQILSKQNLQIPTVVVTALSQKEIVVKAQKFGIINFITKPLKSSELINKAEEVLTMSL